MPAAGNRRRFLEMALCGTLSACAAGRNNSSGRAPTPPRDAQIDKAIAQLDQLAKDLMDRTGVPGMAVAVVRGDQKIYAEGFGTRQVDTTSPVDADTVFQLASLSKSVGSTVVARQVGLRAGGITWDTRIRSQLPWFALNDARVTDELTIADMYSHRSGLPAHAGDRAG